MAAFHVLDLAEQARVRRLRHLHPGFRAARAAGLAVAERANRSTTWSSRPTRTSTTTSPGFAPARSRSTGARSTATWRVDGRTVYQAHGTLIPERARIGFGIWTMLPIRDGRSRSLVGQGIVARWHRFRAHGVFSGQATSAGGNRVAQSPRASRSRPASRAPVSCRARRRHGARTQARPAHPARPGRRLRRPAAPCRPSRWRRPRDAQRRRDDPGVQPDLDSEHQWGRRRGRRTPRRGSQDSAKRVIFLIAAIVNSDRSRSPARPIARASL